MRFIHRPGSLRRAIVRFCFSLPGGVFFLTVLAVVFIWSTIYRPTIGENRRMERIVAEFKSHGCRSIHLQAVPAFEGHPILKRLNLETKHLETLVFGPGAEIPGVFRSRPPHLPFLSGVNFYGSNPSDDDFLWILRYPSVRRMNIQGEHRITRRGFQAVSDAASFHLTLSESPTIREDLNALAFGKIRFLKLIRCELDEEAFDALARCRFLESLSFEICDGLEAEGFRSLRRSPIELLEIDGVSVKNDALEEIARMENLRTLFLRDCPLINDEGADLLREFSGTVHLIHSGLSPEKLAERERLNREYLESKP